MSRLARRLVAVRLAFVRAVLSTWLVGSCFFASREVRADDVQPMRFALRVEAPLLAVGALGWTLSEIFKPELAPAECRLCTPNRLDERTQLAGRWSNYQNARRASDVLLFGLVPVISVAGPVAMALHQADATTALEDVLIIGEALVLSSTLTQVSKYAVARARPYVFTQRQEGRDFDADPDDNLSFFSGHTSSTFALAVAAATTASLRGYRAAPVMWASGIPLAALTGYLRIAADRHYLSDVLTGALVGSAVGVLVPWLHAHYAREHPAAPAVNVAPPATLHLTWTR